MCGVGQSLVETKARRPQEGRVLKGLHPGGPCYGYENVPIEDPTRQGKYGRPAVAGVRLEIQHEGAHAIRRIFTRSTSLCRWWWPP